METAAILVTVAGSVGGGVWILRSSISALEQRVSTVESIVKRELTPNGGDSLRDRIVRIEARQAAQQINDRERWTPPEGTPQGF